MKRVLPLALLIAVLQSQAAGLAGAQPAISEPRVFLLDGKNMSEVRERLRAGDSTFAPALKALEEEAEDVLREKPVSVVTKSETPPSGDKHDYMSQAPYFWPDPARSNGLPYIRRDGERNPEISRITDHRNILQMPETVQTLALAFYFTGKEVYAGKAAEFLRVWFLKPETRMNPHLEFAQAIPGVNTGRGIGIIESRGLVKVVDAVGLLAGSKAWTPADQQGLEKWFAQYLDWMLTSKHGRDEAAAKNNHGTYYDIQVVSFALFLDRREFATNVIRAAREKRIAVQIEPDGRQPLELARTKAWSYSTANLGGLMSLATLGERVGVDLWNFETKDGRGIRRAFEFLLPYGAREKKWDYQQLGGWSPDGLIPLLREAAERYDDPRYRELLKKLSRENPASRRNLLRPAAK